MLIKPCNDLGGYRKFAWKLKDNVYHNGDDYNTSYGNDVKCIQDGLIVFVNNSVNGFGGLNPSKPGGLVITKHIDLLTQQIYFAFYGHVKIQAEANTTIKCGDIIGTVDHFFNNKNYLPHLHFSIAFGAIYPNPPWGYVNTDALKKYYNPSLFFTERYQWII